MPMDGGREMGRRKGNVITFLTISPVLMMESSPGETEFCFSLCVLPKRQNLFCIFFSLLLIHLLMLISKVVVMLLSTDYSDGAGFL